MEDKQNYPFRISIKWYIIIVLLLAAAGALTYYQYGSTSYLPEPVEAYISSDYLKKPVELRTAVPYVHRILKDGEKVKALGCDGSRDMWVETENGERGIVGIFEIKDWKTITGRPDMDEHELYEDYFINIGKKQMEDQYLGRSFAANELNYWPALSCAISGDTLYATYQLRMWDGLNPLVPTVCYVNDSAVAIQSFKEAPFAGNKKWLRATPWAELLYTTPFFHIHWDKPMIPRPGIVLDNWWWIFRIPAKLILIVIAVILALYWRIIICNPLIVILLLIYPLHLLFRRWSNIAVTLLFVVLIICSAYFYMPLFLIEHGSFMTVTILLSMIVVGSGIARYTVRQRCEQCLNVGFINLDKKTLNHVEYEKYNVDERGEEVRRDTEITKDIEQLLDKNDQVVAEREVGSSKRVYITYRYYEYEITKEKKYYDHHCSCRICDNYVFRENEEVEEKDVDKKLIRTYLKTKLSFLDSL
ncbi:MAG: hypothetical protein IJ581_05060 [Paludibacteraceae bacterium]|nr:hypothetical protein [Paludibacteraceae bacterium]